MADSGGLGGLIIIIAILLLLLWILGREEKKQPTGREGSVNFWAVG